MPDKRESSDSKSKKKIGRNRQESFGKRDNSMIFYLKTNTISCYIGATHSLWRKNTKVLLPEKIDQEWNITESSETDPNKTHDILKLGIGWNCLTNAVGIISTAIQIKYKVGPFTSQDITI